MGILTGKNILLISLNEYSAGIINKMRSMGAEVDHISDKPNDGVVCKTLGRCKVKIYIKVIEKYYRNQLNNLNKEYDYILVIRGEYTPANSLEQIKNKFPNAKLILYMWDSIRNNRGIEKKWPYFDYVYTFDRIDYLNNQDVIEFLPLFYYDEYLPNISQRNNEYKYDVSFVGTGHEDRACILNQIRIQCQENGLKSFIYVYLPHFFIFIKNKLLNSDYKKISLKEINFKLLPTKDVYDIYSSSRCIVDIESPTQCGLTMRTIEIVGLKKKLITTNKDIVNYDFYNENNILIVERKNFIIDKNFIEKPYVELDDSIYKKYSLENWLLEVLKEA